MKRWLAGAIVASLGMMIGWSGPSLVRAQSTAPVPQWLPSSKSQADNIQVLLGGLLGQVPPTIPQTTTDTDSTGKVSSYQPAGATKTSTSAFFATGLGGSTNGRTCFTCHQPQDGWALKPSTAVANFQKTGGRSPLFQPVDGSDCPSLITAHQTIPQFLATHTQMLNNANTRIFLQEPPVHDWAKVTVVNDPTTCENSAVYGLNAAKPMLSFYRRPLPTANLFFQDPQNPFLIVPSVNNSSFSIMWDSREADLTSQFNDAVLIHAQAPNGPTTAEINEGVDFQDGIFTAQSSDAKAGDLTGGDGSGATGGPVDLSGDPKGKFPIPPSSIAFDLFDVPAFTSPSTGTLAAKAQRASVARGEAIFNTRKFSVSGVSGLNDLFGNPLPGSTCAACHNNLNAGNDFFLAVFHTGIGDNSSVSPGESTATALPPTPDMPLFAFWCPVGSIPFFSNPQVGSDNNTYDVFETEDPGYGWISGKCTDLGKMKVPVLRGLASRAPFFHGGEAKSMADLVNFYDTRFTIGLTTQDKQDLVNFLNTL